MEIRHGLRILALDTSTSRGSLCLLRGAQEVAGLRIDSPETHSARLLAGIQMLLSSAGWTFGDLDLAAAGLGPGSFTGIRIGVSTALGFAQTLGIAFVGVSCLDALAHRARYLEGRIGVVLDAQRSQFYYAEYRSSGGRIIRESKPKLRYPEELRREVGKRRLHLIGSAVPRCFPGFDSRKRAWPRYVEVDPFLADAIGQLALARRRQWRRGEWLVGEPEYIRPPDAVKPEARSLA